MSSKQAAEKTNETYEKRPQVVALISGVIIAYAITCIVFIGYAVLITYTSVSEKHLPLVVTVTTFIAVVTAGFDSAKKASGKGWFWGMIAGAIYALLLLAIGSWVYKGFRLDIRSLTVLILSIAGGGLGGMIGINLSSRGKGKRY